MIEFNVFYWESSMVPLWQAMEPLEVSHSCAPHMLFSTWTAICSSLTIFIIESLVQDLKVSDALLDAQACRVQPLTNLINRTVSVSTAMETYLY
jgi:hypothetical protein